MRLERRENSRDEVEQGGGGCVQIIARPLAFILCELEGFEQESVRTSLAVVW